MRKLKLLFVLCLLSTYISSQNSYEIGVAIGYTNYVGDLVVPTFTFAHARPAIGLIGKSQLTTNLAVRANFLFGRLIGDDQNYQRNIKRGNRFKASIFEFSFVGEYDLLGKRRFPKNEAARQILSPYVFAGIGLVALSSSIHYGRSDNPDIAANSSQIHPAIPMGMGLRKDVANRWHLTMEWGVRLTFSDYLDGVKYSGDPNDNDAYFFGGFTVGFNIDSFVEKETQSEEKLYTHPF
jgi:hypothetical protein